jgi:protein-ribulosamine 3-kinase
MEGLPGILPLCSLRLSSDLDTEVAARLSVKPRMATIASYGQAGSSTPWKISSNANGKVAAYFMKTGPDAKMFEGEFESLLAISKAVSSLCPRPLAHGKLANSLNYFLVTDFIDIVRTNQCQSSNYALARKLAQLHSTPSPTPDGFSRPVFGFHVVTCVGCTHQENSWKYSWAEFFVENRLRAIESVVEKRRGVDVKMRELLNRVILKVVPRLLDEEHLGGEKGVSPALVHGDLWYGNRAFGSTGGRDEVEALFFDPGSFYAHSEYELGIMKMFGGYSAAFFEEYHRIIPKSEPISEYDDRLSLYQL